MAVTIVRTATSSQIGSLLTQASASNTYLTQISASANYLSKASASSLYLTSASASSTYLTQSSGSSTYLTQTSASTTYATKEQLNNIDLNSASVAIVAAIVDSAPTTLNTLNELAAALGDDPNFATTITNLISDKLTSLPGVINQYAGSGSVAPTGWLFCDGQEVLITTYQNLYNSLTLNGTTFPYGVNTNGSGGVGSTHFRIPNFKGKVPVGKDSSQTEFDVLGESGGSKTSTAPHDHSVTHDHAAFDATSGGVSANHSHGFDLNIVHSDGTPVTGEILNVGIYYGGGVSRYIDGTGGHSSDHTHTTSINVPSNTVTSGQSSASASSGNLQPYITINYIIKT
jgi:microcystin-dependent protein